ncbi:MAG: twin-arginine translocation signal domain-containing protein [Aquabacterium sp.]|uniref:twin-arginine translocation signal domain-containing protein n=1 Tax=Aquabacterium sp. TaxID=1872578 RepID=UPI002A36F2CA|nr:twin-arginine translocation signal domain-containing protein [Aquabacterium sp.]MDX9845129.1 twin-arginine translocation signal domain-containing protein [Aquabacterium sp.]
MVDRAIDHPLMPKRRWFLKTALAVGAVGATLGGLVFWHRGLRDGKLTSHGRDVCHGLARGILGPMLPKDAALRTKMLEDHVNNLEDFIRGTPAVMQIQVNAVLGLLGNAPTRYMLTDLGRSWRDASDAQIERALETMRINPLPTQRLTYQVVRGLTCMSFFTQSATWPLTGYPGPLDI